MGTPRSPADMKYLLALSLVCSVLAQDTYHCPDGWVLEEDRSGCRCFYFEGEERVTRDDADLLCQFHDAWVAELDHPGSTTGSSPSFSTGSRPETELSSGWEPSLESVTLRTPLGNGSGLTRTRLSSGLTGLRVSLTTITVRTVWL